MTTAALLRVPEPRAFLSVDKAKKMLATATTLLEVKRVKDVAEAMRVWARAQKDGQEAALQATEIARRAERRYGQLRQVSDEKKSASDRGEMGGRGKKAVAQRATGIAAVDRELGFDPRRAREFEQLADLPEDVFENALVEAKKQQRELTTTRALLRIANGGRPSAKFSSESVEWYTPTKYIEAARHALGEIDLDPASSSKANEIVKAKKFFTEKDDGLKRQWHGRVWLNPPYALIDGDSSAGVWGAKLIAEWEASRVDEAILLVNANTEAKWFQPFWRFTVCFTDHRIEFYTPSGQPRSPVAGNAFVYVGSRVEDFARAFDEIGVTVRRVT